MYIVVYNCIDSISCLVLYGVCINTHIRGGHKSYTHKLNIRNIEYSDISRSDNQGSTVVISVVVLAMSILPEKHVSPEYIVDFIC